MSQFNSLLDLVVANTEAADAPRTTPHALVPLWVNDELGGHLVTSWFAEALLREHTVEKVVIKEGVGRLFVVWCDAECGLKEGWVDATELRQYPALRQHLWLAYQHLANLKQSRAYTIRSDAK